MKVFFEGVGVEMPMWGMDSVGVLHDPIMKLMTIWSKVLPFEPPMIG
jgi:hypothetical protein